LGEQLQKPWNVNLVDGPTLSDATYGNIFDNIICNSNGIDGVYLGYTYNSLLNNIITSGNGRHGVIAAYVNGGVVASNIISSNNTQDGFSIANSNNIQVDKLYTRSNGAGGYNNIDIATSYKVNFVNFNLDASYGQGIYLNGAYSCKFELGEITNSTYRGLVMESGYDNVFSNVTFEESGQHGAYINNSNYNIFSSCIAKNNSKLAAGSNNGFTFAGTSVRNNLNACIAYDNQVSKTQGYGYSYLNTADYNNISGGNFAGNLTGGLNTNTHDVTDGSNITA
jgi:hypothetical protein